MMELAWLIDQLRQGKLKISICDADGNIISDLSINSAVNDILGSDGKTLSDIYNEVSTKLKQSLLVDQALSYDNSTGTSTADYTVFSTDVSVDFNGTIVIQIIINQATTVQVKLTPSGQTNAYVGYLNDGSSLTLNSWYEFEMNVNSGDAINIIIQVPAGAVLSGYLRIFKRER